MYSVCTLQSRVFMLQSHLLPANGQALACQARGQAPTEPCTQLSRRESSSPQGHSFIVFLDKGFPVSVLNAIKAVPEVGRCVACWQTANPGAELRVPCLCTCIRQVLMNFD